MEQSRMWRERRNQINYQDIQLSNTARSRTQAALKFYQLPHLLHQPRLSRLS